MIQPTPGKPFRERGRAGVRRYGRASLIKEAGLNTQNGPSCALGARSVAASGLIYGGGGRLDCVDLAAGSSAAKVAPELGVNRAP
jgi:hypothetical protein